MKTTPETKEEYRTLEQLNAKTQERTAAHEAQERARTDEEAERYRAIRAERRWRCAINLILCSVSIVGLYALLATENISVGLFAYALAVCLVCVGWHLNEAKRAFHRKG